MKKLRMLYLIIHLPVVYTLFCLLILAPFLVAVSLPIISKESGIGDSGLIGFTLFLLSPCILVLNVWWGGFIFPLFDRIELFFKRHIGEI